MPGVTPQVGANLLVIRIVRVIVGHRVVHILRHQLGRNGVNRPVDAAVRLAEVPDAANIVLTLKDVKWNAQLFEILGSGNPR